VRFSSSRGRAGTTPPGTGFADTIMSATTAAGHTPRTDREGPATDNASGCYYCGSRAIGVEIVDGETRPVCREHAPTGGDD